MRVLGPLYTSFAPTGHPPSQSSGTLMSLQEGIAEPCARKLAVRYPEPNIQSWRAVCGTSPQYSPSPFPHTLPKPSARGSFPAAQPHPLLHLPGEGERIVGERSVCSVATQGVRSGARTGSLQEQGTYRLDPSNPSRILNSQPNHRIQPKNKAPNHKVRGLWSG